MFLNYEKRVQHPLFNLELLKNKSFILNNIGALLEYAPSVPIAFILSLYLQDVRSIIPQIAGLILVLQPITMVIVSTVSGKLGNFMNPRKMVTAAMSINLISALIFATIDQSTSIIIIIGGLIMSGIGTSIFAFPNAHLIMSSVKEKHYGVASATITTMRAFGGMIGMSIVLVIITLFLGHADIAPYEYQGFIISSKIIFIIMGVVYFCGILISLKKAKPNI